MLNTQQHGYLPGILRQAQDLAERCDRSAEFHEAYLRFRAEHGVYDSMNMALDSMGLK